MAVDEHSRHELYRQLEQAIGQAAAGTLMSYLPPVGWADVATKHDLSELERRIELRTDSTEHRILGVLRSELGSIRSELGALRGELGSIRGELGSIRGEMVTRTQLLAMVGVLFAAWSLMLAALKLL